MSTAQPLDPAVAAHLAALAQRGRDLSKREAAVEQRAAASAAARPVDFALEPVEGIGRPLLPWQRVFVSLALGLDWRPEWGPAPSRPPNEINGIAANQIGKSTGQGCIIAAIVTGRSRRFREPGEVWGGMPRLTDVTRIQRAHVSAWLGDEAGATWHPGEANQSHEQLLRTKQGWTYIGKAYEQASTAWESGTIQAAFPDEPPPDDVRSALRVRTMRHDGLICSIFTPIKDETLRSASGVFQGTSSALYASAWEPWLEYREQHPGAKWGEVRPGEWVFALGAMENARSRGGYLPDDRIIADRQKLIDEGKPALALVRYGNPEHDWRAEWVDMAADSLIPWEKIGDWTELGIPRDGFARVAAWIDVAYTAKTASCETAITIAALTHRGEVYVIESRHGQWDARKRLDSCVDLLIEYGCPPCGIQRVGGDLVFMDAVNLELARRGATACVSPYPETGHVPDKVTRANEFAPTVSSNLFFIKKGPHADLLSQARKLSAAYIADRQPCDVIDSAIGATWMLTHGPHLPAGYADLLREAHAPVTRRSGDDFEDRSPMDWQADSGLSNLGGAE